MADIAGFCFRVIVNCSPGVTNKKLPISLPLSVVLAEYCQDPGWPYLLNIFEVHSQLLFNESKAKSPSVSLGRPVT